MPIRYTLLDSGIALEDPGAWNIKDNVHISKILNSNLTQDLEVDFHCYKGVRIKRIHTFNKIVFSELPSGEKFLILKSLSKTRWSSREDVLRAQVTSYNEIKNVLEDLIEDNTQTPDTRVTAEGFRKTLESFQTTLLTVIWDEILQRVDKTSEILQKGRA
ncbi:dimer_Tnp_hAT domain-containing protein [Trichonephila clavata]|uniref:Dimer_Tnp_hAT domain-containing protein n=1 Tax=Trichonephila clavata TaxID=2740835 RepID=A0A8X6I4Q8_TRICU|nr:dimer_Tnp_hAT domain-containing protein [Trichonephila clavata]